MLAESEGNEALRLTEEFSGSIDVMVTDVATTEIGELTEKLSSMRPEMRVLYMSGETEEDINTESMIRNRSGFLQKPFAPDALALKVREVLTA